MNNGAFGENFPYSNFHDLNMDWIIKIAKDFLDQYTHIQEIIEQGKTDIQELTASGLDQLQEKADNLTELLQDWYDEHSEDIANQLADALSDLNDWYTTHQDYLDDTLTENLQTFNTEASNIVNTLIESIPADYSELAEDVQTLQTNESQMDKVIIEDGTRNFNLVTNALPSTGNEARFVYEKTITPGGKIFSVKYKATRTVNQRFFIATIDNLTINAYDTFVIRVLEGEHTYYNGIDFVCKSDIKQNTIIGTQFPANYGNGYYGGTEKSYTLGQGIQVNTEYTFNTVMSYGIGLSFTYFNAILNNDAVTLTKLIDDYIIGETTMNECTETIGASATNSIRFGKVLSDAPYGKLEKLYFNSARTTLTPCRFYIGELTPDNKIKLVSTFVCSTVDTKNEYINGIDFIFDELIPANALIGFNMPPNIVVGKYGSTSISYEVLGTAEIGTSYSYDIRSYGVGISAKCTSIYNHMIDILTEMPNEILINSLKYGKQISPLNNVYIDSDIIHVKAKYTNATDSEIDLIRSPATSTGYYVSRVDFVNFAQNEIGFYKASIVPVISDLEVYQNYTVDYTFVVGHEYDIYSIRFNGTIHQLTIIDSWTQDKFTAVLGADAETVIGSGWGRRYTEHGTGVSVIKENNFSLMPYTSRLAIIGDSYVEGTSLGTNKNSRFSYRLFKELNGDCFIWGQGGASSGTVIGWMNTINSICNSDYYLIVAGMNDTNFETWKTNIDSLITSLTNSGKKVIIATIPPVSRSDLNTPHMLMNTYIRESGYNYVDFAKLLSTNNDGTTYDASHFFNDGIHPTIESHELMEELVISTFPEIIGTGIAK